ncbi:MAG: DUF4912 domain-containing protein [Pirellulaceae bacterium]
MTNAAALKDKNLQSLVKLAKTRGLTGWKSMRKEQLVKALSRTRKPLPKTKPRIKAKVVARALRASSKKSKPTTRLHVNGKATRPALKNGHAHLNGKANGVASHKAVAQKAAKNSRATQKIQKVHAHREKLKDLSRGPTDKRNGAPQRDRLVLMVRDPFWLHAVWTVLPQSVKRAEAALAEHWHTARPYLRLLEVDTGHTTNSSERVVREIEIHGGVTNWYVDAPNPPHSYRVDIGYRAANGKFVGIARSNSVSTPAPGSSDAIDKNWTDIAENYEKVYALSGGYSDEHFSGDLQELFEERLKRPMGNGTSSFGSGAERILNRHRDFHFEVDAEMILFGHTKPDARVTLAGEPVKLRSDGSFTIRLSMPDKRQVLPVVAASPDGVEQRTVVIAIERNTKVLEPMTREVHEQ